MQFGYIARLISMNRATIIDCVKVYKAEVDKLVRTCPHKHSLLELVFFFPRWYKYLKTDLLRSGRDTMDHIFGDNS
jgi:hypothetical protein